MVGRKVKSTWYGFTGTVTFWNPYNSASCDVLVRKDDGQECWYASESLAPADDLGPLPSRAEAREQNRRETLAQLEAIRAQHVADFAHPWPGAEFGKVIVGRALDGAIEEVSKRGK